MVGGPKRAPPLSRPLGIVLSYGQAVLRCGKHPKSWALGVPGAILTTGFHPPPCRVANMQHVISAQIGSRAPAASPAPLSTRRPLTPSAPAWRLHAASLFTPDPQGPFSFWPRTAAPKPQTPAPARKAIVQAESPSSDSDSEPEAPHSMQVGAPRFRSALEQVRGLVGWWPGAVVDWVLPLLAGYLG